MSNRQIDNSCLALKIKLRTINIPEKPVILDCFHGNGVIWDTIKRQYPKEYKIVGIEKQNRKGLGSIYGDNIKVIPTLDLSKYNVIDMDAYGSPYQQIKAMFKNKTLNPGTIVYYTFIQTAQGTVEKSLLAGIGITSSMYGKNPVLYRGMAQKAFIDYLYHSGVKKVYQYRKQEGPSVKIYGYFIVEN